MLRSNVKKLVIAGLAGGALLLGNVGASALVNVSGVTAPVNGLNIGRSEQSVTNPGDGGGSGFLTLVGVGEIFTPLNLLNVGESCQNSPDAAEGCDFPTE